MNWLEILKILAAIVAPLASAILVVRGWQVAAEEQAERELRKEVRSELDAVRKLLDEASRAAISIWTRASADVTSSEWMELQWKIQQVAVRIARLKACGLSGWALPSQMRSFRKHLTLDIERSNRAALAADSVFVREIGRFALELEDALESQFASRFRRAPMTFREHFAKVIGLR